MSINYSLFNEQTLYKLPKLHSLIMYYFLLALAVFTTAGCSSVYKESKVAVGTELEKAEVSSSRIEPPVWVKEGPIAYITQNNLSTEDKYFVGVSTPKNKASFIRSNAHQQALLDAKNQYLSTLGVFIESETSQSAILEGEDYDVRSTRQINQRLIGRVEGEQVIEEFVLDRDGLKTLYVLIRFDLDTHTKLNAESRKRFEQFKYLNQDVVLIGKATGTEKLKEGVPASTSERVALQKAVLYAKLELTKNIYNTRLESTSETQDGSFKEKITSYIEGSLKRTATKVLNVKTFDDRLEVEVEVTTTLKRFELQGLSSPWDV